MFRKYWILIAYAGRYRRGWGAILILTLLSTFIGLLTPLPLKVLVDNVLGSQKPGPLLQLVPGSGDKNVLLLWVAGAELIFFALGSVFDIALTFLWIKVGQSMVFDLARDLFARVQRRSLREHGRMPIGETMARVGGDSWCVHTVVDELCFTPLHVVVTIAGVVFAMASINPKLTVLAVAVVPVMMLASLLLGRMTREAAHAQRDVEGEINSHVQQTLAGIGVVQAFGQEDRHHRQFEELARAAIRSRMRVALAGGLNGLSSGLVTTIGSGVLLVVLANTVLAGKLTVGSLLVFMAYVNTLQSQLGALTGIYTKLQSARASIDRAVEVLDADPEVAERPDARSLAAVRGHIRYEDVSFAYEPDRPVLEDVSLEVRPGQVLAIVGATGAGKSTLVSLLPRFFDPDRGTVAIDGRDLRELELRGVRSAVSLVLQESFLFPISLAENIAYGRPGATRAEIEAVARAANAHRFIAAQPEGYDTVVGERGATLSGGERQRVAIARALLKDAPILILDEPTSALDAETEGQLLEAIDTLMEGRTTLIIAHRLSTIRGADTIVVLDEGRVVESGSHAELLHREGRYAHLHGLQFGVPA